MARTSEDLLKALTEALADADRVIREAHSATRDLRSTLKTERARMEEIVREETDEYSVSAYRVAFNIPAAGE